MIVTKRRKKIHDVSIELCIETSKKMYPNFKKPTDVLMRNISEICEKEISIGEVQFKKLLRSCMFDDMNSRKIYSNMIEYWEVLGYTHEESILKVSEHQRLRSKISLEYWMSKGLSLDESKKKVSDQQKQHSKKFIEKYTAGELLSKRRINSVRTLEYWLSRGYSETDASLKLKKIHDNSKLINYSKRSTILNLEWWIDHGFSKQDYSKYQCKTSLIAFQEKYGNETGLERYNMRIEKFLETIKHSEVYNTTRRNKISISIKNAISEGRIFGWKQSKWAKKTIRTLYKDLRIRNFIQNKENFHCYANSEMPLVSKNKKIYFYDIFIEKYNIVIELNGSYWHYIPNLSEVIEKNWNKKTDAQKIKAYKYEIDKEITARENGLLYFRLWDFEDDTIFINKILEVINAKRNNV